MTERLFAYRGMVCRIVGAHQTGLDQKPDGYLYDLQPIGGGCEIPSLRYAAFEALSENVTLYPQQPAHQSLRKPAGLTPVVSPAPLNGSNA